MSVHVGTSGWSYPSGKGRWNGLFYPAKTPSEIVNRLHAETKKALEVEAVQERLKKIGQEPLMMSPAEFEKYFHADVRDTAKLMASVGHKPN